MEEKDFVCFEDFPTICRVCLLTYDSLSVISPEISNIYRIITDIEISEDDEFPQNICKICVDNLENIGTFIETCKDNNSILVRALEQTDRKNNYKGNGSIKKLDESESDFEYTEEEIYDDSELLIKLKEESSVELIHIEEEKLEDSNTPNNNIGEVLYTCDECNRVYRTSRSLRKHKKLKHFEFNSDTENLKKPSVKNSVDNKVTKKSAVVIDKQFPCIYCNRIFKKNSHLVRHVRVHTGEKPYKCKICNKSFIQDGILKAHILLHTGNKQFQCQHCGKQYYTHSRLQTHITFKHTQKKPPFNCKCKFSSNALKQCQHYKIHRKPNINERQHLCTTCGKSFSSKASLKVHIRLHTGETPYICSYCKKGYHNPSSLKTHVRRNHTGEKPFVCKVCSKSYFDSTCLKRHMKREHPHIAEQQEEKVDSDSFSLVDDKDDLIL